MVPRSEMQFGRKGRDPNQGNQGRHRQHRAPGGGGHTVLVEGDGAFMIRLGGAAVQPGVQLRTGGQDAEHQHQRHPTGRNEAVPEGWKASPMTVPGRHGRNLYTDVAGRQAPGRIRGSASPRFR